MLDQCWSIVYDAGPTLLQHWVDVSCLVERLVHTGIEPGASISALTAVTPGVWPTKADRAMEPQVALPAKSCMSAIILIRSVE